MRIRAVEIRNWACIESLSLTNLQDGIIVLHGPNRTGKTNFLKALRSCLFDHHHDSGHASIQSAIPWRSRCSPSVLVEFEQGPARYRISKTFAKTKEGQASLEQKVASDWSVLARGKDVSERMRRLLGVEKSDAGIYQMLWLRQQEFEVPRAREMDSTLKASLETLLGTMITSRDLKFKERLDKACERWYTVKTMRDRKDSPLSALASDRDHAQLYKEEIDLSWKNAASTLNQYEAALQHMPRLENEVQQAEEELARVRAEREAIAARMARHDLALKNREQAARLLTQASRALSEWTTTREKLIEAERVLAESRYLVQGAAETLDRSQREFQQARLRLESFEQAMDQHQQSRGAITARQQLVQLAARSAALDVAIAQVEAWVREQTEAEAKIVALTIVSEKQIELLRKNRQDSTRLRAELEAGEIHVTLSAHQPLDCRIELDGAKSESASLDTAGERRWNVRQQSQVSIGSWATIHIERGQTNRDIEKSAQRLAELERDFLDALRIAQVDCDVASPIDRLVERRHEHERRAADLRRLRDSINQAAPAGLPALHAEKQTLLQQEITIHARHAELAGWVANERALDQIVTDFEARETSLKMDLNHARQTAGELEKKMQKDAKNHQALSTQLAAHSAAVPPLREKLAQHEEADLSKAVQEAKITLADAEQKVRDNALSEAEKAIETRFQAAVHALQQRIQRARENENLLLRLQTQLAGTEGLHQKRIQADQTVADLELRHQREKLNAEAHRYLKEVFEQIQQEQVRRTVGPINDRVMKWAAYLGLSEYSRMSFGSELLPRELVPANAVNGETIEMESESCGTMEQLSVLIRLAVGGLLARNEAEVAILDDPLAHADLTKHRKMLGIFERAVRGESHPTHPSGPLQLIILTCHPERFDYLPEAQHIDLSASVRRGG